MPKLEAISAVTLATHDMARAVAFYAALGFDMHYGGPDAEFTSFDAGGGAFLNLIATPPDTRISWWGRAIFHVDDVDAMYEIALAAGYPPDMPPSDAPWGERYFHITDPDGHELSFAKRLAG